MEKNRKGMTRLELLIVILVIIVAMANTYVLTKYKYQRIENVEDTKEQAQKEEETIAEANKLFEWKIEGEKIIIQGFSEFGLGEYERERVTEITSNEVPSVCNYNGTTYRNIIIERNAFEGKDKLTRVDLDGIEIHELAFANCQGLTEVKIKNCTFNDEEGFERGAFYNCLGVEKIELASCNNGTHFYGCNNVREVHFTVHKDTNNMFDYNGGKKVINDNYRNTPWYNANNNLTIILDDGIKVEDTMAFVKTTKVEKLIIPIELDATQFYDSRDTLSEVIFTPGVTGEAFDYSNNAYELPWNDYNSEKPIKIVLSEGIKCIGKCQFEQIINPQITFENLLPSSVVELHEAAFSCINGVSGESQLKQPVKLPDGLERVYSRVFEDTKVEYVEYKGKQYTNKTELIKALKSNGVKFYGPDGQTIDYDNDAFNIQRFEDEQAGLKSNNKRK